MPPKARPLNCEELRRLDVLEQVWPHSATHWVWATLGTYNHLDASKTSDPKAMFRTCLRMARAWTARGTCDLHQVQVPTTAPVGPHDQTLAFGATIGILPWNTWSPCAVLLGVTFGIYCGFQVAAVLPFRHARLPRPPYKHPMDPCLNIWRWRCSLGRWQCGSIWDPNTYLVHLGTGTQLLHIIPCYSAILTWIAHCFVMFCARCISRMHASESFTAMSWFWPSHLKAKNWVSYAPQGIAFASGMAGYSFWSHSNWAAEKLWGRQSLWALPLVEACRLKMLKNFFGFLEATVPRPSP